VAEWTRRRAEALAQCRDYRPAPKAANRCKVIATFKDDDWVRAIRHGVAKRSEAGIIEIAARTVDSQLLLSVRDNGPGYQPSADVGVGISNTRARLRTLFGEAGRIEIGSGEVGGTVATVRFPLK